MWIHIHEVQTLREAEPRVLLSGRYFTAAGCREQIKLEQVKFEAQQMVEAANGKAKAIQVEASAIANNPLVLQLRALEKWNGILPQYVGSGSIPFIQVK